MNKRHKQLLSDLNKIAAHFKLKLSKTDVVKKTALAMDNYRKKLLVIDESELPYFKTIDLGNIDVCSVTYDYGSIEAPNGEVVKLDDAIVKVQLQISHVNPSKSVIIEFYDSKEDDISDLRPLIDKATTWRDSIAAKLPVRVPVRA